MNLKVHPSFSALKISQDGKNYSKINNLVKKTLNSYRKINQRELNKSYYDDEASVLGELVTRAMQTLE